mmetsp:Transcript_4677/g.8312  ORF Transcript_4677/g.8312 Transcript_4677/m.8312 type:complete len:119 (-) Transcript_4677:537-893(-)|eukprot:CAMPEP_0206370616 /NCGR_PEP_ID=MMETSP0294-20121207/6000_1 /ASSEMBLY_ACC=CAM_ASM_000327 /TAXON_ID=39354 /ORGANISM="Heterosigma akashiwo, Strain CCMP2393" /LENGTH=118 /DNA_ID=CAMNT_0053817599 /DNA_START=41 /DNA_END=397 /DNA_ORIENTATION=-
MNTLLTTKAMAEEDECWGQFVDLEICAADDSDDPAMRKSATIAQLEDQGFHYSGTRHEGSTTWKFEDVPDGFANSTGNLSSQSFMTMQSFDMLSISSSEQSFQSEDMMFSLDVDFDCF